MTSSRTSMPASRSASRSARGLSFRRRALAAAVTGLGIALTPVPALAAASSPTAVAAAPAAAPNHAAQVAVDTALAQVGKPYVWGGAGPNSFDCSGLTQYAYKAAGVSLPHSSQMQSRMGTPVSTGALQPGDLLFFYSPVSHVGMYIGNGQMVHASTSGVPIGVVNLKNMPGLVGAKRIV